jgi:hypothetical protein
MSILRNGLTFSAMKLKTMQHGRLQKQKKEADNICFADLWDQIGSPRRKGESAGVHIQQVKLETDEGMGDHSDLPNGQKFLQLRRLQQQNQPLEQLDEVIMEIMELMLKSADTASKEQLAEGKKQQQQRSGSSSSSRMERMESSKDLFGTQEDSNSYRGSS